MGGRCGLLHEAMGNQQVAEYGALEFCLNFLYGLGREQAMLGG